ncbi:SAM-dependent chlorinase/fluorinase [Candidatus Kapabacteria bacterium]|nr:SAM-dependent chlorinase/fluorinase [Candidatus Kapabacteria bacterium]
MKFKNLIILSDYGNNHYVGQLKLLCKKLMPRIEIIELSNNIEPQNIKQASFIINNSTRYFPNDSLIVSMLDPSLGSNLEIIFTKLNENNNIGLLSQNNGIFSEYVHKDILFYKFKQQIVKSSFVGRDILINISKIIFESDLTNFTLFDNRSINKLIFKESKSNKSITGEIIFFDVFGNAITNIRMDINLKTSIFKDEVIEICLDIETVHSKQIFVYWGDMGTLEIALKNDNFKLRTLAKTGDSISAFY